MRQRKGFEPIKKTTHQEDKELVKSAMEGNQSSYNTLMRKYRPILYTAASRRLPGKSVEDLEDIIMIVIGQAFIRIHQYNPEKSLFYTWILACLHNYVNSIPGQKKRVKAYSLSDLYPRAEDDETPIEYEIPDMDPFDQAIDKEQTHKIIRIIIEKLPSDMALVIKLKYFKEMSHREISELIGCKENEVWYKLKRAKDKLKKLLNSKNLF
jgi:RNA polymerase sigma-70 factor (ECF subfamily)